MILEQSSLIDILVESFRDVKLALFGFLVAAHSLDLDLNYQKTRHNI